MILTGIFGGSFNPIHKGHIAIAEKVCQNKMVDELWLLVSPQNPLKTNQELLDDQFRLELALTATRNHPNIKVSDFEFHLPHPSYMYNTLQELKRAYPEREFILIIGADNWEIFNKWYRYQDILKEHSIIVYPRPGYDINEEELPDNVHFLSMPLYDISSTEIRKKIIRKEKVSAYLDEEVEKKLMLFLSKQ